MLTSINKLAKIEFSSLDKDKYKQVNKLDSTIPNIYIISNKERIIENVKKVLKN